MGTPVTSCGAAESRDDDVICTTNRKYVTSNPRSYKTSIIMIAASPAAVLYIIAQITCRKVVSRT